VQSGDQAMMSVHTSDVSCPICRQPGWASWLDNTSYLTAKRQLVALSAGFCSIVRGDSEPEIRCMRCHDTHRACAEARSALPDLR